MGDSNVNFSLTEAKFVKYTRKRALLPWWIKVFCGLFMIAAALMPVAIAFGLLNHKFQLGLFGLITDEPLSVTGLVVLTVFLSQGIVAFGLWTEKKWAVRIAKIDAISCIALCLIIMGYYFLAQSHLSIRLEIILLALFYYKLNKIQYEWENFDSLKKEDPFAAPVVNE